MQDNDSPERRRAPRVDCEIPIMLHGHGRSLPSVSSDLSRVGALLRLPLPILGVEASSPLRAVANETLAFLGDRVKVDLHHEILGGLIQRVARPIRVGRRHPSDEYVEIGLDLMRPLTDMEVEFLGIPLPRLYHEVDVTWEPPATSVSTGSEGTPDITVVVCAQDASTAPPLHLRPGYLDADGARADLGSLESLPVLVNGKGAAQVLSMLAEIYGDSPETVILLDAKPVWSGASQLQSVECGGGGANVKLQMGFPSRLSAAACHRLGM